MSGLELPEQETQNEPTVIELPFLPGSPRLALPPDADTDEVAALVAAVATRIEEDDAEADDAEEPTEPWSLAGRFRARRRYELPRECRRGGEWRAAGRRPNARS